MGDTAVESSRLSAPPGHRNELFREATVMVLYVSVVEIAELAGIPRAHVGNDVVSGPSEAELVAIIWGTALGLALAHWFAFQLAARAFRGEHVTHHDNAIALAQVAGAVFVAAVSTLPILLFNDARAQQTVGFVPAALIGVVGYLIARHAGRTRFAALLYGTTAVAVGLAVALVKNRLSSH